MKKDFLFAVSTLIGAIVGLGMFGIPYATEKAGFWVGIAYIIGLGIVMLLLHLAYGEIVERTEGKHRLTGYAEKYLGGKWKGVVGITVVFAEYGSLLAYIIVGGQFLSLLFPEFAHPILLGFLFWAILSVVIWKDLKTVGWMELLMTSFLLLFTVVLVGWGGLSMRAQNFSPADFSNLFLPYGVVLFAFSGIFAIPEIREMLKANGTRYKKVIIAGSIVPMLVYLAFTVVIVGISGADTSQESLMGLRGHTSPFLIPLGAILGILAIATSYIAVGLDLKHTFKYDWHMRGAAAGLLATAVPLLLFVAGIQHFITVISLVGAVFGAIIGAILLLVWARAKKLGDKIPGYKLTLPPVFYYGLIGLLLLGGVYEIVYLLL